MVVQCPNCQAKFKVADDKVTAKGVKIRCSKCANVFTVKPGDAADSAAASKAPPAIAQKDQPGSSTKAGFKDFNFEDFADISTKSKAAPEEVKSQVPKAAPPPVKPPAPKPAPAGKPAAKAPAEDEDLSDFFSAGDAPPPAKAPAPKPEAPKPPARKPAPPQGDDPFADTPARSGGGGADGLDDLFASAPPPPVKPKAAATPKAPPAKPPAPKPVPPKPAPKPAPPPEEEQEPQFSDSIELDTSRGADGFAGVFADAPPPPVSGGSGKPGGEDSFDSLISSSNATFQDAPPPPVGGARSGGGLELDTPSSKTLEFLQRSGDPSKKRVVQSETPNLGLIAGLAVGVFVVAVVGFRAAVEFAPESVPGISLESARSIRDLIPFPVTNRDFPEPAPKIEARVEQTYPVTNLAGETLYVASGKMVNRSGAPMNFLRVRLKLVDKQGQTLQEKSVFAGNMISIDRLQKTDPKEIDSELQRKLGANNSNMNVGHNTTVNFMVIFYQYGAEPGSVQIIEATAGN